MERSCRSTVPTPTGRGGGAALSGPALSAAVCRRLRGATVAVADPAAVAARWGEVLGVPPLEEGEPVLALEGGEVRFEQRASRADEGLVEIAVELPAGASPGSSGTGGVRLRYLAADPG